MRKYGSLFIVFTLILAPLVFFLTAQPPQALAAGCVYYQIDRDGDGVPDEKDPYPDDPTRSTDADRYPSMRVSLIPSSEAVSGPVDEFTLDEKSPVVVWVFENKQVMDSVRNFVEKEKTAAQKARAFDPVALRAKIEFPKDFTTFYVDQSGVISRDQEVTGSLSGEEFQGLETAILALRGIVDLKENRHLCRELPIENEAVKYSLPDPGGKPVARIAMIPFSSAEAKPAGLTTIAKKAQILIALYRNSEVVTEIRSVLQGEGELASIGAEAIHFQAEFPIDGISIAVDKDGGVSQDGEVKASIGPEDLKFLEEQAQKMRGVVDMRVQSRLCSLAE